MKAILIYATIIVLSHVSFAQQHENVKKLIYENH